MEASEGNWPRVETLARKLVAAQPSHRTARAFLGLAAFKEGRYQEAEDHFNEASGHPIGELTSTLARAWIYQAQNKTQEALNLLDGQKLPDWAAYFLRYHRALIADVAGRTADARAAYERIAKNDQRTLRISLAYASHAGHAGDTKLAQSIINAHLERAKGEGHPSVRALLGQIEAGKRPDLLVRTPAEGLSEVFFGLGEALSGEGSIGSRRRPPAVLALSGAGFHVPAGDARQRPGDDQTLRSGHRRVRPHSQGHAARGQRRDTQGAEPQSARACGRGKSAAGRAGAPVSARHPPARGARQHHARAEAVR